MARTAAQEEGPRAHVGAGRQDSTLAKLAKPPRSSPRAPEPLRALASTAAIGVTAAGRSHRAEKAAGSTFGGARSKRATRGAQPSEKKQMIEEREQTAHETRVSAKGIKKGAAVFDM